MTYTKFNAFCRALPATTYVVQWGGSHVWKVGGKVFAIGGWQDDEPSFTFKVSDIAYELLKEHRACVRLLIWHRAASSGFSTTPNPVCPTRRCAIISASPMRSSRKGCRRSNASRLGSESFRG